jgi:hypothetical protein
MTAQVPAVLEAAIAQAVRQQDRARRSRDTAEARVVQLEDRLERLRAERDRQLTGTRVILAAPAELVADHGLWYWRVRCPYCGEQHRHGGSEDVPPAGVRVAHCHLPYGTHKYVLAVACEVGA